MHPQWLDQTSSPKAPGREGVYILDEDGNIIPNVGPFEREEQAWQWIKKKNEPNGPGF